MIFVNNGESKNAPSIRFDGPGILLSDQEKNETRFVGISR